MNIYAEQKGLGQVLGSRATMHLARCRKFKPDILFVKSEQMGRVKENQVEGPADMVVEIVSESTRDRDLQEKRRAYQETGVDE